MEGRAMWDALFQGNAVWFSVPALAGTGLFLLKLALMLMGHHGGDGSFDVHDGDVGHAHDGSDSAFKLLTVQGILGFMMGFGWAGLGVLGGTDWKLPVVFAVAIAAGVATMYLMGMVMASMMQLQVSGNINISSAVGVEGTVYTSIPAANAGNGQVTIVVDERQRTYNAVTAGEELPRNARVRVVGVTGQNTLSVIPA
jgi:membrane protein implicated in regulation of membrane protease activity